METDFLILGYGFTARYAAYELSKKFPDKKVVIVARQEDIWQT
jgi:L-2-hydroxyglutarate oxidase LhgO